MLSNFQGVRKDKRVRLASFSPPGRRSRQGGEGASTEMCGELAHSSAPFGASSPRWGEEISRPIQLIWLMKRVSR